ncbi:MAG: hypothetical protein U1F77_06095 [Kiritimatiellia bacterium]
MEMGPADPAGVFQDTNAMMPMERIWWPIDPFFGWSPFWHLLKVVVHPAVMDARTMMAIQAERRLSDEDNYDTSLNTIFLQIAFAEDMRKTEP